MPAPLQTIMTQTAALQGELEKKRRHYWRLYLTVVPILIAVISATAAFKTQGAAFPWPVLGIAMFAVIIIGFQIANTLYRSKTKIAFLAHIAAALNLNYSRRGLFSMRDIDSHQILPHHDIERIEDGFSGTVNGVRIMFEEASLSERRRRENPQTKRMETEETLVFWGLIIRIGIGKNLHDHTIVMPRSRVNTFFRTTLSKYKPVNLVSPKFEEKFDTIATDQVEARYVLDPAFMERFMEADALANTKWLSASFQGSEIAIAIQRFKPMFEIGALWRPLTEQSLAAVLTELTLILKMVETLKLNPYTGLGAVLPVKEQ